MISRDLKEFVDAILSEVDIRVNGDRPWDVQIHSDDVYPAMLHGNTLALGELYMEGFWDCEQLDDLICRLIRSDLPSMVKRDVRTLTKALRARFTNPARRSHAFDVGRKHYDIGNDLYQSMLDPRLVYSCGYWRNASTLEEAQEAKLDLICRKLRLREGMRVLDIGGGWGSFAKYAAEKCGVSAVNITVSERQVELADQLTRGLPVENRLQDYRDLNEKFDAIVSIGMFEHVGPKNYRTYFQIARRSLNAEGLFLLHTIGSAVNRMGLDPWIERYIFPNSMIPSMMQIAGAIDKLFVAEDWHNIGPDYDPTLMHWYQRFSQAWETLKEDYGEHFRRMWRLYLLGSAGTFRARNLQVWQVLLSPRGVVGGLEPVR